MSSYTREALTALELQADPLALKGPLLPLLPPKASTSRTQLAPERRRARQFPFGEDKHPEWVLDSFVVPAAFPRSVKGSTQKPTTTNPDVVTSRLLPAALSAHPGTSVTPDSASTSASTKPARIDPRKAVHDLLQAQLHGLRNPTRLSDQVELQEQEQMFVAVNRFRKTTSLRWSTSAQIRSEASESGPCLTLVMAHANGFHKETFEPMISDLLDRTGPDTREVEEIWTIDTFSQGDSATMNEEVIGRAFNWADHARDILNFLISYLPDPSSPDPTSSFLPCLPPTHTNTLDLDHKPLFAGMSTPSRRVYRNRLVIGLGHSLSGAAMATAASAQPSLFSSLLLVDPGTPPPDQLNRQRTSVMQDWSIGAFIRKERWASREKARESLKGKLVFQRWDERCLDKYIKFGTIDLPDGAGVRLKTRPKDEALAYGDPCGVSSRRCGGRLPLIPTILPIHFIWPQEGCSVMDEKSIADTMRVVPHATFVRVDEAAHLVIQENPAGTAQEVAKFLNKTYPAVPKGKERGLMGQARL